MKKLKKNGVDRISNLSDDILHLILSGLQTTEEVVGTSILSTRWRHLWTSIPFIDIDYFRKLKPLKEFDRKKFEEFVNRVLANKSVDLDSFRLSCSYYYDMTTISRWIQAALIRNVKVLDLMFLFQEDAVKCFFNEVIEHIEVTDLPNSPITCGSLEELTVPNSPITCGSLVELRLFCFRRPLYLPNLPELLTIRVLKLNSVELTCNDTCSWLTDLINLEDLSLIDCSVYQSNFSQCVKLKKLRIVNRVLDDRSFGEITMYCPKLVFLELAGVIAYSIALDNPNPLKKAVIHRDDMLKGLYYFDFFENIARVESLTIGIYFLFKFVEKGGVLPSLHNLKTLEITTTIDSFTMDVLLQFLKHPNLESLNLIIQEKTLGSEYWKLDESETMAILTSHLKRVEFVEFDGDDVKLDIARLMLEHGNALEEMVFSWNNKDDYNEMSMETIKEVSNFHKASSTVKLIALLKD